MPPYKRIRLYEERTGIVLLRPSRSSWPAMTRFIGFSTVFMTRTLLVPIPGCDIWFRLLLIHRWNRLKWYIWFGGILNLLHPLYHFVGNTTAAGITLKIHCRFDVSFSSVRIRVRIKCTRASRVKRAARKRDISNSFTSTRPCKLNG